MISMLVLKCPGDDSFGSLRLLRAQRERRRFFRRKNTSKSGTSTIIQFIQQSTHKDRNLAIRHMLESTSHIDQNGGETRSALTAMLQDGDAFHRRRNRIDKAPRTEWTNQVQ